MTKTNTNEKNDYQTLFEELEIRYGAGLAQEIVEQVKIADNMDQNHKPDFMPVKALSETLELFRAEARISLRELRNTAFCDNDTVIDMVNFKKVNKFQRNHECYTQVQHAFYTLYNQALKGCEVPRKYVYDRKVPPTEMKIVA